MASEITEEQHEKYPSSKEEEKIRIRQIIAYQKSLHPSSSSSSSSSACSSFSSACSSASPRKRSSLLHLMKVGSTSLGRLFDMEHTSLGDYFKDYSVSPVIKPILLWGSESDSDFHDDPWADIRKQVNLGSAFGSRSGGGDHQVLSSEGGFKDDEHHRKVVKDTTRKRKLVRTRSYRRLPRFSLWRCWGFRFKLRLVRKLRLMIRGRKL